MTTANCPNCGIELAADTPLGLCPQCLLREGMPGLAATMPPSSSDDAEGRARVLGDWREAPSTEDIAPLFPQLQILELIGQGGMGAVYKALQTKLNRHVALKVLPPRMGNDVSFAQRFMREAQALAKLNHAHIVTVYDFGEVDGLYYLLMEFVDGVNLRDSLQAGNLTPQEALAIVPQLCDALQFAHEEGIVHRDIKPENVLLDRRGRVKIADFGLAKLLDDAEGERRLTVTNQVMGTLNYMAPEQIETPLAVDHRADIYSLGVVFYELLTGELPMGRFPLPSEKAAVTGDIDEVVLRTLEKEPDRRFQQASDVKTAVERLAVSRQLADSPAGRQALSQPQAESGALPVAIAKPVAAPHPPHYGAIANGSVMLLVGLVLLGYSRLVHTSGYFWVGFGIILGGGGVLASAWKAEKRARPHKLEQSQLVQGLVMCALGLGLLAYGIFSHQDGLIWVGFGISLGGGGCLHSAWRAENSDLRRARQAARDALPRKPFTHAEATTRLHAPAIALQVTAAVTFAITMLVVAMRGGLAFSMEQPVAVREWVVLSVVFLFNTGVACFVFLGGWLMQRVRSRGLAMAASIVAIIPLHVGFMIGIPMGIWALVALADSRLREAFDSSKHVG